MPRTWAAQEIPRIKETNVRIRIIIREHAGYELSASLLAVSTASAKSLAALFIHFHAEDAGLLPNGHPWSMKCKRRRLD